MQQGTDDLISQVQRSLLKGRWHSTKVAKIYLSDGLSYFPDLTFSKETKELLRKWDPFNQIWYICMYIYIYMYKLMERGIVDSRWILPRIGVLEISYHGAQVCCHGRIVFVQSARSWVWRLKFGKGTLGVNMPHESHAGKRAELKPTYLVYMYLYTENHQHDVLFEIVSFRFSGVRSAKEP